MKRIGATAILGTGLLLTACDGPVSTTTGSATIFLLAGSGVQLESCTKGFGDTKSEIHEGSDGSSWVWLKDGQGTLSHYCRRESNGTISAWEEASRNEGATHQLKFESDDRPAVFQEIQN